ncbi:hypothetical protein VNI00_009424 [Paramarasmius palmivorus]|uniref:F-box domain-containing protein n=1 Tax=Paramarasmius palmivorus TaxID=297713 RepID=A0AAW0CRE4_9AGAR
MRRLPQDVLSEIFLQCLPKNRLPLNSIAEAPLLLTRVCRSWRSIALSTPRLWRAIHLAPPGISRRPVDDRYRAKVNTLTEGLKVWLERARRVPLTISIAMPPPAPGLGKSRAEMNEAYSELMNIIPRYSRQLKGLCLRGLWYQLIPLTFHNLTADDIPLLESLHIGGNYFFPGSDSTSYPLSKLLRAPSLRSVSITDHSLAADPFTLPVSWHTLTELRMNTKTTQSRPKQLIHTIACTCPSLRICELSFSVGSPGDFTEDLHLPVHRWRHLWRLDIAVLIENDAAQPSIMKIFDVVETPSLSWLALGVLVHMQYHLDMVPFLDCLARSRCSITHMDLELCLSSEMLIACLERVPSLTTLRVSGQEIERPRANYMTNEWVTSPHPPPAVTPDVIRRLGAPDVGEVLCPRLERITLERVDFVLADQLAALVVARSGQDGSESAKLLSLKVVFQSLRYDASVEKIALLKERGVVLSWVHDPEDVKESSTYRMPQTPIDY